MIPVDALAGDEIIPELDDDNLLPGMVLATWRYLSRQTRPVRPVRRARPSDTSPDPDRAMHR